MHETFLSAALVGLLIFVALLLLGGGLDVLRVRQHEVADRRHRPRGQAGARLAAATTQAATFVLYKFVVAGLSDLETLGGRRVLSQCRVVLAMDAE